MAERNDLQGWSLRAAGRYAGLSVHSVRTLLRLDPWSTREGALSPIDVLSIRVLGELGANRSVNRGTTDDRSVALKTRDSAAISLLRHTEGSLGPEARLLIQGETARLVTKDFEVLAALSDRPSLAAQVLPVGRWMAEIAAITAKHGSRAASGQAGSQDGPQTSTAA